jgi:hypothetical protein
MATRADFTDEEWDLVSQGPTTAGFLVLSADRGGMFRETFSMAKAYAEARRAHGASALLDAVVSERPRTDRSGEFLRDPQGVGAAQLREAVELLRAKASPDELEEYRRFVLAVAERVAEAHRENGADVSPSERAALDRIRDAVGGAPA